MTPELAPAEGLQRDPVTVIRSIKVRHILSAFGLAAALYGMAYVFAGVMK